MNINHEWSEDGDCTLEVSQSAPAYKFKVMDILGIGLSMISGYFNVTGQGFHLLSREFFAAAEFKRQKRQERIDRRRAEIERMEAAAHFEQQLGWTRSEVPE